MVILVPSIRSRISVYLTYVTYLLDEKIVDTGMCYASEIKHHRTAFKNCFKYYGKTCGFDWKRGLNTRISIKVWRFPPIFVSVVSLDLPYSTCYASPVGDLRHRHGGRG